MFNICYLVRKQLILFIIYYKLNYVIETKHLTVFQGFAGPKRKAVATLSRNTLHQ